MKDDNLPSINRSSFYQLIFLLSTDSENAYRCLSVNLHNRQCSQISLSYHQLSLNLPSILFLLLKTRKTRRFHSPLHPMTLLTPVNFFVTGRHIEGQYAERPAAHNEHCCTPTALGSTRILLNYCRRFLVALGTQTMPLNYF